MKHKHGIERMKRGPDGKWLSWGGALEAWLPALLSDARRGSGDKVLSQVIEICLNWSAKMASSQAANSAKFLAEAEHFDGQVTYLVSQLQRWQKRRAVLLEAAEKLMEIG